VRTNRRASLLRGGDIRVLLTHPHSWNDVRRGAERELRDLAISLSTRGHRVTVLTGAPRGLLHRDEIAAARIVNVRTPAGRLGRRRGWSAETGFASVATVGAALSPADVVHCLHYADAWGALRARRVRRHRPVILKLTGTVEAARIDPLRVDRRMFRAAVAEADEVWCNSEYARTAMAGFGREMHIVPAAVDLATFVRSGPRDPEPLVVCTSSPGEPRKRVVDLVEAWAAVRAELADARLVLAGPVTDADRAELWGRLRPEDRDSVRIPGPLDDAALVDLLSRAHVAVSPSVFEALGLATLEALACGTPVAGARSGATPSLIRPGCGAVFEPNDPQSCAEAVLATFDLAAEVDVEDRCRDAAEPYDLEGVTTLVEQRYQALADRV
jgi:glycosyltransferase involved in cell wall biosynthesis